MQPAGPNLTTLLVQCAAAGIMLLNADAAIAEQQLQWRLDPDQQLRLRLTQTIRTELDFEEPAVMSLLAAMEMRWRVDRVDQDGTLHLSQAFTRLILRSTSADGSEIAFDSASAAPPTAALRQVADAVQPLLASRFTVAMSPRGEFEGVGITLSPGDASQESATGPWTELLSPSGLERALRQSLGLLPEGPVRPGDSWHHQDEIQTPQGPVSIASTYRYQGSELVEGRSLEIIQLQTRATPGSRGAFDKPSEREQRLTGTYRFDATAGHLVQSRITQTLASEIPSGDRSIRMTASSTLATTLEPLP